MTVYVLPLNSKPIGRVFNVTSRSQDKFRALSPFLLGPVDLYDGHVAKNVENAWQYTKVYKVHDNAGIPNTEYWKWAEAGWDSTYANRYPMGKGAVPEYSWWKNKQFNYIEARRSIYFTLYRRAVLNYARAEFNEISIASKAGDISILDFDAYNHHELNMSLTDVLNNTNRKMGHGFVLARMLEKQNDQNAMWKM